MRKDWTEWHLTPRGWERGATRIHEQGNTWIEEPLDRLLSCVYQELETGDPPRLRTWSEETWRSKNEEEIAAALAKSGPCPERL